MSKYIIDRKGEYYRLLREVTEHSAWEPWILYMLDAVEVMSALTRQRIIDIRALLDDTLKFAKSTLPSRVYSKDIIELVFRQPYTKGQFLVDMGIAERKTAADYLQELEKIGILKRKKVGRENLYLNEKLYNLLSK
jgi:Fic family protein